MLRFPRLKLNGNRIIAREYAAAGHSDSHSLGAGTNHNHTAHTSNAKTSCTTTFSTANANFPNKPSYPSQGGRLAAKPSAGFAPLRFSMGAKFAMPKDKLIEKPVVRAAGKVLASGSKLSGAGPSSNSGATVPSSTVTQKLEPQILPQVSNSSYKAEVKNSERTTADTIKVNSPFKTAFKDFKAGKHTQNFCEKGNMPSSRGGHLKGIACGSRFDGPKSSEPCKSNKGGMDLQSGSKPEPWKSNKGGSSSSGSSVRSMGPSSLNNGRMRQSEAAAKDKDKSLEPDVEFIKLEEEEVDVRSKSNKSSKDRDKTKRLQKAELKDAKFVPKKETKVKKKLVDVYLQEGTTVATLSSLLKVSYESLARMMIKMGFDQNKPDYVLNTEIASLIVMEYGMNPHVVQFDQTELTPRPEAEQGLLDARPPIVTIMGTKV
jgi:hypothetical protein